MNKDCNSPSELITEIKFNSNEETQKIFREDFFGDANQFNIKGMMDQLSPIELTVKNKGNVLINYSDFINNIGQENCESLKFKVDISNY